MVKQLKLVLAALAVIAGAGVFVAVPAQAGCSGTNCISQGVNNVSSGNPTKIEPLIKNIINMLLFIIGVVAVIMIIIGGFRYVVSGGDQSSITGAKNTILYAVIGLIVAALAFAIVNFVVSNL